MPTRKTALAFEDRTWVEREIDRLVAALEARQNGRGVNEMAASALVSMVTALEGQGDPQAARVVKALLLDGAVQRVAVRNRQDDCLISWQGKVLSIPARIGVPARGTDGVRRRNYNQRLWWRCTWAQLRDWLAQQEAAHAQQGATIAVVRRILALNDQYPDTMTPGEACERAGVDPREFQLDHLLDTGS